MDSIVASTTSISLSEQCALQNDCGASGQVFIVRHSERLDEVDEIKWKALGTKLVKAKGYRTRKDVLGDPPITQGRGKDIAREAGVTLLKVFTSQTGVFTSRLIRAVETAIEIARVLKLPLYVSKGISSSAAAVRNAQKAGRSYSFESMEDLRALAPDVQMFCVDVGCDIDGRKCESKENIGVAPLIHKRDWVQAINDIYEYEKSAIIVAHRETIRNLANERLLTKYCCISKFEYDKVECNFRFKEML